MNSILGQEYQDYSYQKSRHKRVGIYRKQCEISEIIYRPLYKISAEWLLKAARFTASCRETKNTNEILK